MNNLDIVHKLTHSINQTTAFAEALQIARVILEEQAKGKRILIQDSSDIQELLITQN